MPDLPQLARRALVQFLLHEFDVTFNINRREQRLAVEEKRRRAKQREQELIAENNRRRQEVLRQNQLRAQQALQNSAQ